MSNKLWTSIQRWTDKVLKRKGTYAEGSHYNVPALEIHQERAAEGLSSLNTEKENSQDQEEANKAFAKEDPYNSSGKKENKSLLNLLAFSNRSQERSQSFIASFYDTGHEYRSMAWAARSTTIGFVVSMLLNIALCLCIFMLMPLKEVQPYLLALKDKGEQVVYIEPIQKDTKGLSKLIEGLCRQYVMLRETIDCVTDEDRWLKHLFFLSSEEIWQDFASLMNPDSPTSPLRKYKEANTSRSINITVSSQISETIYQVEWQSITTRHGQEMERQRWVSTMEIELRPNALPADHQFINPIGFTVTKYSVSKREE